MTLVERFIEIDRWSTSRKTVLLMGFGLPAHLADWLMVRNALAGSPALNAAVFDMLMAAGAFAISASLVAAAAAAWAGKEARWTAYLTVVLVGGFFLGIAYVFGLWTTPSFTMMPVGMLACALWYGKQVAWFTLIYTLCVTSIFGILQASGALPYAPVLIARTLEAQQTGVWIAAVVVPIMVVFSIGFILSLLVIDARKLQETRLHAAQKLIRRYIPAQVADAILAGREETASQHERRRLSIFFSDLVGFTDISEELEPEDLSRLLNEYFSEMTDIAQKHGGTVDELSGDAILVFFGAPQATNDQDHALRAVRMAQEMQQAMPGLNARWRSAGITESLSVRMGINTGVVTVGNFGSSDRMKYAALGKHVNLAARLQANCEPGKVLLSHATWLLVNDQIPCASKGEMNLKGINKPVMAYEPTGAT